VRKLAEDPDFDEKSTFLKMVKQLQVNEVSAVKDGTT
jgi:hypothetical protein|tara:strand:- start:809 stop:919 length:111 start_codon:yes stop_codon:yes gene_type:complete